jgi:hypothetical protein
MASPLVAHRFDPDMIHAGCGVMAGQFWQPRTDELLALLHPTWCEGCWPGLRCTFCAQPSGGHDECSECLAVSITTDKALERRQ